MFLRVEYYIGFFHVSFDRFLAIASSTARNCFKSSSRLDFFESLSDAEECVGDASAETPTAVGFLSSIVIGDLFFGGSTTEKRNKNILNGSFRYL